MKALLAERQLQDPFIPRRPLKLSPTFVVRTSQCTPQIHLHTDRECSIPLSYEKNRQDPSRITLVPPDRGSQARSAPLHSVPTDVLHATMRSLSTTQDVKQERGRMFVETSGGDLMWMDKLRQLHDEQLKTKGEIELLRDIVKANDLRIDALEAVYRRQKARGELANKHGRGRLIRPK